MKIRQSMSLYAIIYDIVKCIEKILYYRGVGFIVVLILFKKKKNEIH